MWMIRAAIGILLMSALSNAAAQRPEWAELHDVRTHARGWEATGVDPFVVTTLPAPMPADACICVIELRVSAPVNVQIFWSDATAPWRQEWTVTRPVQPSDGYQRVATYLDGQGTFDGAHRVRLDVGNQVGVVFDIRKVEFYRAAETPAEFVPELVDFKCYTSKLHYLPGERIEYRAALRADCYPDRQSAKVLELDLHNADGQTVASKVVQYGIRPTARFKDVQGVLDAEQPLKPGKYTLHATSRDLRSGLTLQAQHIFGVQGQDDPFVFETPFKFVKDFSIVRGPDGRWHIFSITGDFFDNHDWMPDGQERTFSHSSSADLRHWTYHPPVVSISDKPHPDGVGKFKNRNVWAPHVIKHDGKYWMFYTSVNEHVSQSISLATSEDLFHWTEYEQNPVFTPEDVEWADWARDRWGDCRDACVLKDGDRFYLYATVGAKPPGDRGAIVVAESDDLVHWKNARIAVRRNIISESPQVWKDGDTYCMTTSSLGGAMYVSDNPVTGWQPGAFARPNIQAVEKYVPTSGSYAEEVVRLPDGSLMIAGLTWRHWGNSIYLFRIESKDGVPVGYESPWNLTATP